jgi:hypothetical protein
MMVIAMNRSETSRWESPGRGVVASNQLICRAESIREVGVDGWVSMAVGQGYGSAIPIDIVKTNARDRYEIR